MLILYRMPCKHLPVILLTEHKTNLQEGVENLMKTVNPGFPLNQMQLDAIQEEVQLDKV